MRRKVVVVKWRRKWRWRKKWYYSGKWEKKNEEMRNVVVIANVWKCINERMKKKNGREEEK